MHAMNRWWMGAAVAGVMTLSASTSFAGWPFSRAAEDCACYPPAGIRQFHYAGKTWPMQARPSGPADRWVDRFYNTHYWPDPHRFEDRCWVRNAFAIQRENGWVDATTLNDQHFDSVTQQLTLSGRRHLMWIARYAPTNRRTAWVASAETEEITQLRLANVQREAARFGRGNGPQILVRDSIEYGTPAEEIDFIRRSWLSTMPPPRLAAPVSGQGGGSTQGQGQPQGQPQGGGSGSPQSVSARNSFFAPTYAADVEQSDQRRE
jgi:hypothetical protein